MTRTERAAVTRDRILRARLWLIPCALIWIPMGIGTMHGLAGSRSHSVRQCRWAAGTHSMQLQAWIESGSGTSHTTVEDNTGYTWQFTPGAK